MNIAKKLALATVIISLATPCLTALASAQDDIIVLAQDDSGDSTHTANVRNEYAHERNLRLSGKPTKNADGSTKLSDDASRDNGKNSLTRNGTGVFEDHPVTGASR